MGRSYFVEEAVGQYLSELNIKSKPLITGLLVGQCSPQRDYVILAIQTPPKDEEKKTGQSYGSDLLNIDEEWITAHANQVSRMLPGGLLILGVFTIAIPELAKEIQNTLCRLVFAVEKSIARKRLWAVSEEDVLDRIALHLCPVTKKLCRTYNIQDPKTGLVRWAKEIEEAVFLINGQVKEEDADLLEGQILSFKFHIVLESHPLLSTNQLRNPVPPLYCNNATYLYRNHVFPQTDVLITHKKRSTKGNMQASIQPLDVRVLTQLSQHSSSRCTAAVQVCSGSINLKGALKCKAYVHNNKPKVKDAIKALKEDVINTLSDRCEVLFEDMLLNGMPGEQSSERQYHSLPCRVFAPIAGSRMLLCDYKFGDETVHDIQERFLELLDQTVQAEDVYAVEEVSAVVEVDPAKELSDDVPQKQLTKEILLLKLHQNMGAVIALAVAISAAAFSFNYFSD